MQSFCKVNFFATIATQRNFAAENNIYELKITYEKNLMCDLWIKENQ
jgi:hypothetical protein